MHDLDPNTLAALVMVGGGIIALLQAATAFFLKSIHGDFKAMVEKVNEHQERIAVLEYRISSMDGKPARVHRTA